MGEIDLAVGCAVPPHTPHAISVSLPTWGDVVGYEEGDKRVVNSMTTGYPRFFIHLTIQKLAAICEHKYAIGKERCMLFATKKIAELCRSFIESRSATIGSPVNARLVNLFICPEDQQNDGSKMDRSSNTGSCVDLHIVLFPGDAFPIAKQFWQHTGLGISSRLAEKCLSLLPNASPNVQRPSSPVLSRKGPHRYYSGAKGSAALSASSSANKLSQPPTATEDVAPDSVYLEERFGRNLPLSAASFAKRTLRSRVAGVLVRDASNASHFPATTQAKKEDLVVGPSKRGIADVAADDVYLFPSGMASIWSAHNMALSVRPPAKSICFGFPYADTLKVLEKWGPGSCFFGFGTDSDIDELEKMLEEESKLDPSKPPILALFTEFPSNPLLRSPNLRRLRALADQYDFLIVVDETVGNYVNVEVLPHADIVVSSLTKVFSGASNVMGGSLVLNPKGRHYDALKAHLNDNYEDDIYFDEDAIYMERNSRDFKHRIRIIDANAEAACDFLRSRSVVGGYTSSPAIKEVYYPKYITRENYDACRIQSIDPEDGKTGGFGGLFSLTFTSIAASKAFFDALPCYKGPSLGTNFTLACPFTILAHFAELDWAAQYGVEAGLVRISVGMEDTVTLLQSFETALKAAEAVSPGDV
ncbi:pyridoxal phosphate-dependent transferase [Gymnopilus junonius]|uniref:cystathionine gamma-synthase n=1 Tax=Gymnopilus junonius TaxID=109634 RepID=A0A9P5TPV2_GYMJU|nr:pyridoxal phosphate-dependent transferase [Gymnopilus junonius]